MQVRAVLVHETGGPEVLRVENVELAPPGPTEARVAHRAIGVNFIDTYHRSGLYALPTLPHGLGVEGAGVVEAIGDEVTEVKVGDRVAYVSSTPGSYAEARNVPASRLVRIPPNVPDELAAAVLLKGMTVEYLIHRTFPVAPGMTVLWHAIAGGVGLIAAQWLSHLGVTVIGTTSSESKAALATEHGCTHVIDYTSEDVVARVRELTDGRGVPVVYDSVGRSTFDASLACLSRRGMLVGFGNASGAPEPFDPMRLARSGSLYYTRATLFDYVVTRAELLESASKVFGVMGRGALKVHVGQSFRLDEARRCHEALESRGTRGATVLRP
ncbi:MAG: quinone oxidoreductase [Sandaracinus sp.]|nr:quinone oxidoreductase [Sandaracinus sp.]MCB9636042.1 quinone oxidoreductase [Sandaracinus sp.]